MTIDSAALVERFRPFYRLQSEEMWYPCHPEDQLRTANLVRSADGSVVIPALADGQGSVADQLLCTPEGLEQLAARGVHLDAATVQALQPVATGSPLYTALTPTSAFVLERADDLFMPPYGYIASANFEPAAGTWFHRGAPNNPETWLGGDASAYGPGIVQGLPGVERGAWQEPVTGGWVQRHTVAGVDYVDVIYTAMLGWNGSISMIPGQGEHPNDVETVVVRLGAGDLDNPVRYMLQQHGGLTWYDPQYIEHNGDRMVVYLARESHEVYPSPGRFMRIYGIADDVCDRDGILWDAPAQYLNRPQGVDAGGVDVDALRCSISKTSPSDVVLVPVDDPGPLWQYVRFQWLARGGAASDSDFTHQPFPLSTTKWWPEEGPAAPTGPLAQKAAEPSAPGVPPAFFNHASAYLGQDPLPTCSGVEALAAGPPHRPEPGLLAPPQYTADIAQTAPGKDVGGDAASLAPNAPFVDWRGSVGAYLLGSVNSNMPGWLKALPDPLPVPDVVDGKLKITDISLSGLHGMIVAPVVATSVAGLHIMATAGPLSCAAMISVEGIIENDPATVTISSIGVDGVARVVTPLAVPADDSTHWYVPYVGPQPFSYATPPFATTQMISDASLATVTVTAGTITVDVGNATLDAIIDGLILLVKQQLENTLASALQGAVNGLLGNLYDGTKRF